ncbi:MAG: ParA family protein, partial [Clostridia bacterium]|nr:ParA family protein [Clostridia bacterium]
MKIISVTTQKGGVGKTTSAINISAALAEKGKKVLLVDLDPQGNASIGCGIDNRGTDTIVRAMQADINGNFNLNDLAITKTKKFAVLPSNIELSNLELILVSVIGREGVLKRILEPIKDQYDYIIIDTLPSLGILTVNAFTASDYVIVPILAKDYYSLQG